MKKLYKILALGLSVVMLSSLVACGGGNEGANDNGYKSLDEIKSQLTSQVDYTDSTEKFNYYAYKSLNDGTYTQFSVKKPIGEDFLSDEYIIRYFESGMTYIMPQTVAVANSQSGTPFEETKLKKLLDQCHRLGYDNSVIVADNQLFGAYQVARDKYSDAQKMADWELCSLIGEGKKYANEAELDAFVEVQLRQYYAHPAFGGVMMYDEPSVFNLKPIGELYKSVRRVEAKLKVEFGKTEDMFINANLLPSRREMPSNVVNHFGVIGSDFNGTIQEKAQESYRQYIDRFLEVTDADYVQVDIYPMLTEGIEEQYLSNLHIMAEVAKKYDAKIIIVTQTNNDERHRVATYESVNYLNNICYGFGAQTISYYAYHTLDDGSGAGGHDYNYDDNGCMVNRFGDKTAVYDIVKELNVIGQNLAQVILNFDYRATKTYFNADNSLSDLSHLYYLDDFMVSNKNLLEYEEFVKLSNVEIDKEGAIVTELYDAEKNNYMYMVMNATDPLNKGSLYYQTATLTFASEYNKAVGFFDGGFKVYDLDENGSVTVKMRPGEAHYLIPFTA